MLWKIVSLNAKLFFLLLYFMLSIYIFERFANSGPYLWLLGVLLFNVGWRRLFIDTLLTKLVGLIIKSTGRDTIGSTIFEKKSIIRVFLSLILIWYKSNATSINKYS